MPKIAPNTQNAQNCPEWPGLRRISRISILIYLPENSEGKFFFSGRPVDEREKNRSQKRCLQKTNSNADAALLLLELHHPHRPPHRGLPHHPRPLRHRVPLSLHQLCRLKARGQEDRVRSVVLSIITNMKRRERQCMYTMPRFKNRIFLKLPPEGPEIKYQ